MDLPRWNPSLSAPPAPEGRLITERQGNQPASQWRDPRKNVEINIGKACNNRCVFCIDGLPKAEDRSYMPWEQMQAELDRWYAEGYRSVGFLGGEPTTYPRIVDAVAHARALGFTRVTIATNATKLRLEHFTDRLLDAGLTRVTISMHGHTAELEDRLTRVPGNFEKKCAAIRLLVQRRRQAGVLADGLSVNIVLNGWNYRYLPKMMQFFYEKMGVDDLRVNFIRPEGYAEGDADLTPPYADVVPQLIKGIVLSETHFKKVFTFGGFPMCVLPPALRQNHELLSRTMGEYRDLSTACSIRSTGGDLIPPGEKPDPSSWLKGPKSSTVHFDEAQSRARFNWQDRKRNDLKGHPAACARCDLNEVCEGVWKGYLEIRGDAGFKPVRLDETALGRPSR
jgi:MoaA/NifB/PqqE/SkfB family radical SAM enzyme